MVFERHDGTPEGKVNPLRQLVNVPGPSAGRPGGGATVFQYEDILILPFTAAPYIENDANNMITRGADYVQETKSAGPGPYGASERMVYADYGASFFKTFDFRIRVRWTVDEFTPAGAGGISAWIMMDNGTMWAAPYFYFATQWNISNDWIETIISSDNFTQGISRLSPRPTIPFTRYYEIFFKVNDGLQVNIFDDANFSNLLDTKTAAWNNPMDYGTLRVFREANAWNAAGSCDQGLYDWEMERIFST